MSADPVLSDVLLSLHFATGVQTRGDVERLLTQEPFYRHDLGAVRHALAHVEASGWLSESDGGIRGHVPLAQIVGSLPPPETIGDVVAALSDDELVILEAVLSQHMPADKDDLAAYGFAGFDGARDPWRLADASRGLGRRRLVVETLADNGVVVFRVPSIIATALRLAYDQALDARVLPARRETMLRHLKERGWVKDARLEEAFRSVRHEHFLPEHLHHLAYSGATMDLETVANKWRAADGMDGWGVTRPEKEARYEAADKRQSSDVLDCNARMLALLDLAEGHRVLLCGATYGYFEALVATLVGPEGEVVVVDQRPERIEACLRGLKKSAVANRVRFQLDDPTDGYPGKFDRIALQGSVPRFPRPVVAGLSPDGVMFAPIVHENDQVSAVLRREKGVPTLTFTHDAFLFEPLKGRHGWGDVESLTNIESLRAGTQQLLRSRFLINRAWQTLRDRDLLSADVGLDQAVACLLEPADDDRSFGQFSLALQGVGTERLQEFLPPPETAIGITDYGAAFAKWNIVLPKVLEADVRTIAERLGPARRVRNFIAHPSDPEKQAETKKLFRQLLGVPLPSTPADYGRLQRVLLDDVAGAFEDFAKVLQKLLSTRQTPGR